VSELTAAQRDIRWLIVCCQAAGIPKPESPAMEAFAERVAIRMADGMTESEARELTFREQFQ
jgi:hypothetical protein